MKRLPSVMVYVDGIKRVALVDSGCTSTMVKAGIVWKCDGNPLDSDQAECYITQAQGGMAPAQ